MTNALARAAIEAAEAQDSAVLALESIAWIASHQKPAVRNDLEKLIEQLRGNIQTMGKAVIRDLNGDDDRTFQRIRDVRAELEDKAASIESKIRLDRIEQAYHLRLLQLHQAKKADSPLFSAGKPALDLIEIIANSTDGEWTREGLNDFRNAIVRDARTILNFAEAGENAPGQTLHQDRHDEIVLAILDFLDGDETVEQHLNRFQMASSLRGFILQAFKDRVYLDGRDHRSDPDANGNPVKKLIASAKPLLEEVRAYLDGNDDSDMESAYAEFVADIDAIAKRSDDKSSSPLNTMDWLNSQFRDRANEDPATHTELDAAQVAQAKRAFLAMLAALKRMILEVPMGAGQAKQVADAISLAEGQGA